MHSSWWTGGLQALGALAVVLTAQTGFAQTADGVGGRTTAREVSADEAAAEAQRLQELFEYEPRFYAVAVRAGGLVTPNFILDGPFALHTGMWEDGVTNLMFGAEFTTRIPDKFDLVVGLDWAGVRTSDGFWLEDGDPIRDADYTESTLSLITADVGINWFKGFGRQDRWQVYGGPSLGLSLVLGDFLKYDIDTDRCGWDSAELRGREDPALVTECETNFDNPFDPDSVTEEDRIPPVLPSISLTVGMRYLMTDSLSIAIEGGWKNFYAYGGLEFGYYWYSLQR